MAAHDDPRALLAAYRAAPDATAFRNQLTAEQRAALSRAVDEDLREAWNEAHPASNDVQPTPPTAKPKKKIKQSKEFAGRRSGRRKTELKVIVRHSEKALGKHWTLKALAALFPNRDINNPEDVIGADIGNALALTVERIFKFEELASAYAKAQNYGKPSFAFNTITACDAEAEELGRERRKQRNRRVTQRRREYAAMKRSKAMLLETANPTTAGLKTLADLRAEQKARTRAQCDAICDALAHGEQREIAPLIDAVRRHPAWQDVADDRRYRTMVDRLDMLRDQGRIEDDRKPGPRGTFLRLVRLKIST